MDSAFDASLADFPRLSGETDDAPRFDRAVAADTRMEAYSYYSNAIFKLDDITCISHRAGTLTVADASFVKQADHVKIYEGNGKVVWRDCRTFGFSKDEVPFEETSFAGTQSLSN